MPPNSTFEVGGRVRLIGMPDSSGMNGLKAELVKTLGKDRWVVMVDGEAKSRMVTTKNLQVLGERIASAYSIVGTWDDWEPHQMAWNAQDACFEYTVVLGSGGVESFRILCDEDWERCVYPDRHDANPYEDHLIKGPDDSGGDFEWTIGRHHKDPSFDGAQYQVRMLVFPDGTPKKMLWELAGGVSELHKYSIVGTWDDWEPHEMIFDSELRCFEYAIVIGSAQTESFKILVDGDWEKCLYPSKSDASPHDSHAIMGPADNGGDGQWTIGFHQKDKASKGQCYKVHMFVSGNGQPSSVTWDLFSGDGSGRIATNGKDQRARFSSRVSESQRHSDVEARPERQIQTKFPWKRGSEGDAPKQQREAPDTQDRRLKHKETPERDAHAEAEDRQVRVRFPWKKGGGTDEVVEDRQPAHAAAAAAAARPARTASVPARRGDGPAASTTGAAAVYEEPALPTAGTPAAARPASGPSERAHRTSSNPPQGRTANGWGSPTNGKDGGGMNGSQGPTNGKHTRHAGEEQSSGAPTSDDHKPAAADRPSWRANINGLVSKTPKKVWEIVGGAEKGGIIVRLGESNKSEEAASRLSNGATVEEVQLVGERLQYKRLAGAGPEEGWISISHKGHALAQRVMDAGVTAAMEQEKAAQLEREQQRASDEKVLAQVPKDLLRRAKAKEVPLMLLDSFEKLEELLDRIEALDKMTASKLQVQYTQLGFAAHDLMARSELSQLVKEALIWRELKLSALQEVCRARGMDVEDDQPHAELWELLANATWEANGIPVSRFPSIDDAFTVLDQVRSLESMSGAKLASECRTRGLPTEVKQEVLVAQLKQAFIWDQLPTQELILECKAYGVRPNLDDGLTDEMVRIELIELLSKSASGDRYEARGIPLKRLGSTEVAEELLGQVERLQSLCALSLRLECKRQGIAIGKSADKQALAGIIRDVLIWERLPSVELQQECRQRGLARSDGRNAVIARLRKNLNRELEYEAQGIPVLRLRGDPKALEQVVEQYEYIDKMSMDDLIECYKGMGVPEETSMEQGELVQLMRMISVWQALPLVELENECLVQKVSIKDVPRSDDEEEQRELLVDKLFQNERLLMWEARGYRAKGIGNFQTVLQMVTRYEQLQSMSDEDIDMAYGDEGLLQEPSMGREDLLRALKAVMIWQALPLSELRLDASKHDPPIQARSTSATDEDKRQDLIQQLIVDMLRSSYEMQGIPVKRTGLLEAYYVGKQLLSFEVMTDLELKVACEASGLPVAPGTSSQELITRLREVTLWEVLPAADLWAECQKRGIEEELRESVLSHLLLRAREAMNFEHKP